MKKAFVSCLFGNYDVLKQAPKVDGWDSILFTDQYFKHSKGWDVNLVHQNKETGKKQSRYYKWMTHITLPQYDMICYMDASMTLIREPKQCMWFKHPRRTTVEEEAKQIIKLNKANVMMVDDQMNHYWVEGFKDDFGMYQNGFFIRSHDYKTNVLCDQVYKIVKEFTYRDQLAMPFALFKTGYKMQNLMTANDSYTYMKITPHL